MFVYSVVPFFKDLGLPVILLSDCMIRIFTISLQILNYISKLSG